ncbi:hypothetical protein ABID42_000620 [Arcicella rosea]
MLLFYTFRRASTNCCPKCKNILSGERTRRPFIVKLFLSPFFSFKYYQCLSCYAGFFIPMSELKKEKSTKVQEMTTYKG